MSHTYAILTVQRSAYAAIRALLVEAGYAHAFHEQDGGEVIDMHGIALQAEPQCDYISYSYGAPNRCILPAGHDEGTGHEMVFKL